MRKKIVLAIALLVMVAAAIVVAVRWHAWFGQPEEEPYAVAPYPHRLLLTFGDSTELSRNVSWQCDTAVKESHLQLMSLPDSAVTIVPARGEVFESRAGKAAYYHARLRNLRAGGEYAYRVSTGGETSGWHRFSVGKPELGRLSFVYSADVQDTVGGISGQVLAETFRRFPEAEFYLCAGDLVERPTDKDWGTAFQLLDSLAATRPVVNVTGNHDYLKGPPSRLERRFPLVFSYFLESAQGDNMVYTLRYGDTQLFLLDSHRGLPSLWQQRDWLKARLQASTAKWKILVVHHPVYSIRTNHIFLKWLMEPLITEYGIDLVLQGHEHNYARKTGRDREGLPDVPIYVISNLAPKNYTVKRPDGYDLIETGRRYVQLISIDGDTLQYRAYRVPEFVEADSFTIVNDTDRRQKRVLAKP